MGAMNPIDIAASHRTHIGCSKVAQALGISRWGTPYDLWLHYTGRQLLPDISHDLRVALCEPMEQVLAPFVEQRLGGKLRRDRKEYKHPTLPLVAHVDFRLSCDAEAARQALGYAPRVRPVTDIKTSLGHGAKHRFGADGTDELDTDVLMQVHSYNLMVGSEIAFVAALVPGPELKIYTVRADAEIQDLIEDGLADFWRCVTTDTPPDARNEADARRLWAKHAEGKILEADNDLYFDLRAYATLKARMRVLEKDEQTLKDSILPRLTDAESVWFDGKSQATFKANKDRETVNWQAIAKGFMEGMSPEEEARHSAAYATTQPGARVLRLSKALEAD